MTETKQQKSATDMQRCQCVFVLFCLITSGIIKMKLLSSHRIGFRKNHSTIDQDVNTFLNYVTINVFTDISPCYCHVSQGGKSYFGDLFMHTNVPSSNHFLATLSLHCLAFGQLISLEQGIASINQNNRQTLHPKSIA